MFGNCRNVSPCNGLVIKSVIIASVRQYLIVKFPFLIDLWGKKTMSKCLVLLLELCLPLFCSIMILLLSWYIYISYLYPYASRKSLVYSIIPNVSSAPTRLASVLLFVFSFSFCDTERIAPFPLANVAPVRDFKCKGTTDTAWLDVLTCDESMFTSVLIVYR